MTTYHRSRKESIAIWFQTHVCEVENRNRVWLAEEFGKEDWLKMVPLRNYPHWARSGCRFYRFRSDVKRFANEERQARLREDENAEETAPENAERDG